MREGLEPILSGTSLPVRGRNPRNRAARMCVIGPDVRRGAGRRYPELPMKDAAKRREMGSFHVDCEVANVQNMTPLILVPKLLVDTGSEYTWVPESVLRELGIQPVKKDLVFQMANGQTITRSLGFAFLRAGEFFTVDEVVFGQPGDRSLLGARTLEGFGARVDPQAKRLVASGPHLAALAGV